MAKNEFSPFSINVTNNFFPFVSEITERIVGRRLWFPQGSAVDYPNIGEWSQQVYNELKSESKRAIVAVFSRRGLSRVVGAIIYQRHKTERDLLELKHLSVDPAAGGRRIAAFLLRQAEVEGLGEYESAAIVCDAKVLRTDVYRFLIANHYAPLTVVDLYGFQTGLDVVFRKEAELIRQKTKRHKIILPF